jgi:hypothetical protein
MAGDGDPDHFQAVGHRGPAPRLVRRGPGEYEPDPIQAAHLATLLGQDQVAEVDRVERPAAES